MLFITGQLFINYKRGVVFSPFYHYGMYSSVINPEKQYRVTEVHINGKRLAAKDFSPQQWDNILLPLEKFYAQKEWNNMLWQTDILRLMPFADEAKFTNTITEEQFNTWYQLRLESITRKKIDSFHVRFTDYAFDGSSLIKSIK